LVQVVVVTAFDLVCIGVALTVDGIGYAGWLGYLIVSAILAESVRALNSDVFRDVNAKGAIPYLPLLELCRMARMRDPTMGLSPLWREGPTG